MNANRRRMMTGTAAALAGSFLAGLLRPGTLLAAWNQQAFDAKNLRDALQALGMGSAVQSRDILIGAPDDSENGALVPVQITSRIPGTRSIAIFVDRNPWPHIARFEFAQDTLPYVALRLRVAETSPVRVVVRAGDAYYVATKDVKVVAGGCGGPGAAEEAPVLTRAEPIKIRARLERGVVDLRALVTHPMENGLRMDPAGRSIANHFIQNLDVRLNGKTVLEAEIGRSVSTNPLFAFRIQGAKADDRFALTWRDNKGLTRTDEATVSG
jgi:sulfur-oxidizing protein SoxY